MKKLQKFILNNPELSIVSIAVLIRVVAYIAYPAVTVFNDSDDYINLSYRLINFNLEDYGGFRTPGYSLLIALAFQNLTAVVILQHILSIATALFIYYLVRQQTSMKSAGIIAATIYSSFVHVIFFEKGILTETLSAFLLTWLFWKIQQHTINKKIKPFKSGIISCIVLLLVLTKPFFVYLLPVVIGYIIALYWSSLKLKVLKPVLIIILPSLLFYTSWMHLNKENTGYATITSYYGINLAQEIVYFAEKAPDEFATIRDIYVRERDKDQEELGYVHYAIWHAHEEMMAATGLNFSQLSNRLAKMSKETMLNHPWDYSMQIVKSWIRFWGTELYWDQDKSSSSIAKFAVKALWHIQKPLLIVAKWSLALLFFIHLLQALYKRHYKVNIINIMFAVIFVGSVLQAMVNYSENYRFSFPYLPAIIIILVSYSVRLPYLIKRRDEN